MKIELIQPFINSTDAVLAEMLQGEVAVTTVTMNEEVYRRKGVAASVAIRGDIVGHIIFDLEPETALRVAAALGNPVLQNGPPVAYPVAFRVSGPDYGELRRIADDVAAIMRGNEHMRLVHLDWNEKSKVVKLDIDQNKARALGVSSQALARAAYLAHPEAIPYESQFYRKWADLNNDGYVSGESELMPLFLGAARDFSQPLFAYGPPRLVRLGVEFDF